jgi:hypothetical protein
MAGQTAEPGVQESKILYSDCSIPASLFFHIVETKDFSLLGTGNAEQLEAAYNSIFDEYVMLSGSEEVIRAYKKSAKVGLLKSKIEIAQNLLYAICFQETSVEERLQFIDILNSIESTPATDVLPARYHFRFNKDKPIFDEIEKCQQAIGILENELNFDLSTEKKLNEAVKYIFESDLVNIQNALGYNLPDDLSLKKFIYLKQSAIKKSQANKPKKTK